MRYPFEDKFDVKYDEKAFEEYSKQVNKFTVNYLSQDSIIKKQEQEISRLNNIINEFEELVENEINESKLEKDYERVDSLEYCLATLKELKENK